MKRYAVIDVGTNSVKFVLGEPTTDGGWRTIVDRAEVTRLGEGLDETGRLGDEPVARTVDAIAGMADEARRNGAEAIAAVGTAALRKAPNRAALIDAVRERTGVEVEVVSGEEEARLAYLAVTSALELGDGSLVVFDTGRRQLPVHLRARGPRRRALQPRRRRGAIHRAVRARRGRLG